jgi:hypothetical protein
MFGNVRSGCLRYPRFALRPHGRRLGRRTLRVVDVRETDAGEPTVLVVEDMSG